MDPISLSVTQLCRASVDPEWLERWIAGEAPSVQVFAPPGSVTAHGTQFHKFACRIVRRLLDDPGTPSEVDRLYPMLLEGGAAEFLDGLLEAGNIDSAAQLTNALHFFAQRLAQLHARKPKATWTDVFVEPEFGVKDARFELGGGLAFVSGAIDCVRHHGGARLEVVDYKLTRGTDLPKEMVQVALYRELLKRANGASPVGALEYFAPTLHVQELSESDLDATYQHWVVPTLTRMIRARQTSMTTRGNAGAPPTPAVPTPAVPRRPTEPASASTVRTAAPSASPVADAPALIALGKARGVSSAPITLDPRELKRHVAVLGGSGSGKTTLALSIIEQVLAARIPVLLVDRKGDLCRYGDPSLATSSHASEPLRRWLAAIDVAVFTPGQDRGRGLAITLLPPRLDELPPYERADAYKDAAAGLGGMLQLKSTPSDQAKLAVLVQALRILGEGQRTTPVTLSAVIELLGGEDPALLDALGPLDPKHCKKLAEQLQTMQIMRGELLAQGAEALSAELLFGLGEHSKPGKTRLSIISTKFLGDDAGVLFYVSQLLLELNRYASRSPAPVLQAAVMFDEADIYLPATSKPATKAPLESLLKRARSAGVSVMLATQSPGDLDYRCRENVRNWFVGLVKEPRAIEKLKPLLSDAKLDAATVLPKQKVGQFFMLSETAAVPLDADRNLLQTEQLAEPEILEIARATRARG
jgi:DNA helicase HerA-like ATPase